ncbi:hypothetical protein [Ferruginibacter albus]|uniref:hypothetical protein n=1 Tax=Ferruginibacter albus TaxID=2875540 RepID=UPI001CC3D5A5|nr:hypothetical protein [Ferruginibacter albus]UAY52639.1 hypothetical protein K9M53_02850 [Ferruginibacter albus]
MKENTLKTIITMFFIIGCITAKAQSEYGQWRTTSCFKGIDFCVKKASYNESARKYEWWVKFRNRYTQTISFDFTAKESYVTSANTTDRVTIKPGDEGGSWFLVADANSVKVFVDHLRFGNDDWGTAYAPCDN